MPSRTTNWNSTETWQRLIAAIVATGIKLDLHEVAKMYGTTYDTIQNRYRKIRKDADALRAEVESGEQPDVVATPKKERVAGSGAGTPTPKRRAAKDVLGTVTNGRVSKPSSPAKKTKKAAVQKDKNDEEAAAGDGDDEEDIFHGVDFGVDAGDVGIEMEF